MEKRDNMLINQLKVTEQYPIDKQVLKLMLERLQYLYDNRRKYKNREITWIYTGTTSTYSLIHKRNCNGWYLGLARDAYGLNMVVMVKVYEKTNSLRIIADDEMAKLSPENYDDIVRGLLNPRNKNKTYYSEYSYY